jgi:hypothetical protein
VDGSLCGSQGSCTTATQPCTICPQVQAPPIVAPSPPIFVPGATVTLAGQTIQQPGQTVVVSAPPQPAQVITNYVPMNPPASTAALTVPPTTSAVSQYPGWAQYPNGTWYRTTGGRRSRHAASTPEQPQASSALALAVVAVAVAVAVVASAVAVFNRVVNKLVLAELRALQA